MAADFELGARLLAHDRRRLVAMSASIAVGVVIMFVQIGLLQGILDAQSLVAQRVVGDLLVMNQSRIDLHHWNAIRRFELAQVAATPGVAAVTPLYEDHVGLTDPKGERVKRIIVYAFPPDAPPLAIGDPKVVATALRAQSGVLFDRLSRPIFGSIRPGATIDIDRQPFSIVGLAKLGPDIINDGAIFMSEGAWLSRAPTADPMMGVVRLARGADLESVRRRIYQQTPNDIVVLTPKEARRREDSASLKAAPIGFVFGFGVIAGMVIGAVNGYQVLFTQVSDLLAQYATLKAMGFSERFLQRSILAQALTLSVFGFGVGLPLAILIDLYIAALTRLPIQVHLASAALVALATVEICALAGRLAMRRLAAADPASLF